MGTKERTQVMVSTLFAIKCQSQHKYFSVVDLQNTVDAAYSGHLYSGQPLRVDDFQSPNEQIYNTETAGYKGQPLLVDKSVR